MIKKTIFFLAMSFVVGTTLYSADMCIVSIRNDFQSTVIRDSTGITWNVHVGDSVNGCRIEAINSGYVAISKIKGRTVYIENLSVTDGAINNKESELMYMFSSSATQKGRSNK